MYGENKPATVINGVPWWNFIYVYDWDGKSYEFHICARSQEEADARLKRLPLARSIGPMCGNPMSLLGGGWTFPLIAWWRNFNQSRRS